MFQGNGHLTLSPRSYSNVRHGPVYWPISADEIIIGQTRFLRFMTMWYYYQKDNNSEYGQDQALCLKSAHGSELHTDRETRRAAKATVATTRLTACSQMPTNVGDDNCRRYCLQHLAELQANIFWQWISHCKR